MSHEELIILAVLAHARLTLLQFFSIEELSDTQAAAEPYCTDADALGAMVESELLESAAA